MIQTETFEYYFNKYGDGRHDLGSAMLFVVEKTKFRDYDNYILFVKKESYDEIGQVRDVYRYKWHRLDGPARISSNRHEWWINDKDVTEEISAWAYNNNINLKKLTEVDKAIIKLFWADYGK